MDGGLLAICLIVKISVLVPHICGAYNDNAHRHTSHKQMIDKEDGNTVEVDEVCYLLS